MNKRLLLQELESRKINKQKSFAVLVDPDNASPEVLDKLILSAIENHVDYFLVGGSLMMGQSLGPTVRHLKQQSNIPVILFPGSNMHIDTDADGLLFLSLISGRNADLLIGQHVLAAPLLKMSGLQIMPTGYILVDSGSPTTVSYVSNTFPIPHNKPTIAACTAMAGEMLGLRLIYLDAGSGAAKPVSLKMINAVAKSVDTPIIVGGGIRSASEAVDACRAGADMIVIGNGIEDNPELLVEIGKQIKALNYIPE